ncbi:SO2930 family diheme c-type cytochrome [uncultured Erythrobacter sp.]|uniref:SO2930 family diheme c-type cytochrome n=1 Tax=uncultured Erythrobacter sp. TaxID=263913 RepID=UPI002612B4D4|nr:SO2930 family diheme c-type cytochrome [uncultured Erythrobacter sp.]
MRRSFAFLGLAAGALALSLSAHANVIEPMPVHDGAVLESGFPRTLDEFQFFQDSNARTPTPGVIPYELNTPLYSDGADKLRFLYVPEGARIGTDGDGLLQFPVGSAIIKTFAFGEGDEQRYIETRVLLHRADGWIALPYRWNDEQSEARLALAGGRLPITTADGEEISYRIPNKNQCKSCHGLDDAVVPIGPKARNLSPTLLAQLVERGQLDHAPEVSRIMPVWGDAEASTDALARAYLDVNCAHCHRPGAGASNSGLDLRWEQDDAFAIGVRKPPVAAGRGAGGFLVSIAPGDPDQSILVHRMNSTEPGVAMPELGRSTVDGEAVELMRDWIREMDQ